MTESCELCGRGYAKGAIAPAWYPHQNICDRTACREASKDAVVAIYHARDRFNDLIGSIATRHQECWFPVGARTDAFAKMDAEGEEWWALEIAKNTERP